MPTHRLSAEAEAGWVAFARAHGITRAAMEEVIGRWLAEHDEVPEHLDKCLTMLVEEAETVDAERRSRRPR